MDLSELIASHLFLIGEFMRKVSGCKSIKRYGNTLDRGIDLSEYEKHECDQRSYDDGIDDGELPPDLEAEAPVE